MIKIGLVGATNVGKSTLFNRMIGQFRAIVTDIPGTTTDILYHPTHIPDFGPVIFADSPGLMDFKEERPYIKTIVDSCDLILFVVDDSVGMTAKEQQIYQYILEKNKRKSTIMVVNKLDKKWKEIQTDLALADYYEWGFDCLVGISAKTKRNLEVLEEMVFMMLEKIPAKVVDDKAPASTLLEDISYEGIPMAIIGKPNAGKSTLMNTLMGKSLSKVDATPGTTRDYVVGSFTLDDQLYTVFDTAGIKKKGHMLTIEKIAYKKTLDMLEYIRPVVLFMVDVSEGISHRDMTLLAEINRLALPTIFALNKSDLFNAKQLKAFTEQARRLMDFAPYIPILGMSAKTGIGTKEVFEWVKSSREEATKRIETRILNKAIANDYFQRPPCFPKNKICKVMYISQININAPTFLVFVNRKERANFAFKKWIENSLRRNFGFVGTPLVTRFRDRRDPKDEDYHRLKDREQEAVAEEFDLLPPEEDFDDDFEDDMDDVE